jgi:hypothetical protein
MTEARMRTANQGSFDAFVTKINPTTLVPSN